MVADYKAMDGVEKYFVTASGMGAGVAVVLACAPDASILAAIEAKKKCGIEVMVDLIGVKNRPQRAREVEAMGADYIMLHLGHDEAHADPSKQVINGLDKVVSAVSIPVAVSTFTMEEAVEAVRIGASIIVQGEPILSAPNRDTQLARFVETVKTAR